MRKHRISYELIEGHMIEHSSRELHQTVVAPTLTLLAGKQDWKSVETAYRNALEEIARSKPDDAITDAGTALQAALELLGCDGNALGPLIKSARKKGLIAAHDTPIGEAVERIMHWVSADRSEKVMPTA